MSHLVKRAIKLFILNFSIRAGERGSPFPEKGCWLPRLVLSESLRKLHKQLPRLGQLALRRGDREELIARAEGHPVDKIKPPKKGLADL